MWLAIWMLVAISSQLVTKEGEVWKVCHHQAKAGTVSTPELQETEWAEAGRDKSEVVSG